MEIAFLVAALAALVALALWGRFLRRRRRELLLKQVARSARLRLAVEDPFDTHLLDLEGLDEVGAGDIRNVLWGRVRRTEVRLFEISPAEHPRDGRSAALIRLPDHDLPRISIDPTGWQPRRGRVTPPPPREPATRRDVRPISVAFERRYRVTSDRPGLADLVLDDRLRQWLLRHGRGWRYEAHADLLLVTADRLLPPPRVWELVSAGRGLAKRLQHAAVTGRSGPDETWRTGP